MELFPYFFYSTGIRFLVRGLINVAVWRLLSTSYVVALCALDLFFFLLGYAIYKLINYCYFCAGTCQANIVRSDHST